MAISYHASAITVDPTVEFNAVGNGPGIIIECGNDSLCFANVGLTPLAYGVDLLLKSNDPDYEYGPFEDDYKFNGSHTSSNNKIMIEKAKATPLTCPDCFLVLYGADEEDPIWTIDISAWDGTSVLHINDFYLGDGDKIGVSKVELYGVSAVPIPAAVWLFGSGLLGLVGVARRKKA